MKDHYISSEISNYADQVMTAREIKIIAGNTSKLWSSVHWKHTSTIHLYWNGFPLSFKWNLITSCTEGLRYVLHVQ